MIPCEQNCYMYAECCDGCKCPCDNYTEVEEEEEEIDYTYAEDLYYIKKMEELGH